MMPTIENIHVTISGAVQAQGLHSLSRPATIRKGLDAAGGFAVPTSQMKPADAITVRRPSGDHKVDVFRFSTSDVPPNWEEFELQNGDFVVFRWRIEPEKA
jgi:protein involved in polysaccharide export with SLBB domain